MVPSQGKKITVISGRRVLSCRTKIIFLVVWDCLVEAP